MKNLEEAPVTNLALHQITANEAGAFGLVSIAKEVGCPQVVIFTHIPQAALQADTQPKWVFPLVTPAEKQKMLRHLDDNGVSVSNIEFFPLTPATKVEDFRPALELGAAFSALRAVAHVHDPEDGRAVDTLGKFCDLAAEYGIAVGLEFMPLAPACPSLRRAEFLVRHAARTNLGIAVDCLHFVRSGGKPADLIEIPASLFSYAQLCDGAHLRATDAYLPEAMERLPPGEGVFPIAEILRALPANLPLDVEVPSFAQADQGVPALDRTRNAVGRSQVLLDNAERGADRRD